MPFWRLRLLLLLAAASACLGGCNSGDSPLAAFGGGAHPPNSADAAFLRSMTEHERATLGIPRLAERRALRAELRGIALKMTTERRANLRDLGSIARGLPSRGARRPKTGRSPGSALLDLTRVKDATSFDHEFMRTMIEQNQRAIAIAQHEVDFGSAPAVRRLAAAIGLSRKKELEQLRKWLHLWYGDIQPGPGPGQGPGGGGNQKPSPTPDSPGGQPRVPL